MPKRGLSSGRTEIVRVSSTRLPRTANLNDFDFCFCFCGETAQHLGFNFTVQFSYSPPPGYNSTPHIPILSATTNQYISSSNKHNLTMAPRFLSPLRSVKHRFNNSPTFTKITSFLPPLNFITVHYTYFLATCLVTSLIFYGCSDPKFSIGYTDSLFLVVSAMTEAGLNTVNLSQMTTGQQFLLWFLIGIVGYLFLSCDAVAC
jgi:hypothetical protein